MPELKNAPLALLKEITSLPTAPFAEDAVSAFAKQFVKARPALKLRSDAFGNLLIERVGRSRSPRWIFSAHTDHPGLVAERMIDATTVRAAFHGGVYAEFVQGAAVRFFSDRKEIAGTIMHVRTAKSGKMPVSVDVRVKSPVAPKSPGMFDLGKGRLRGKRFESRALDDLAGVAAALAMLDQLGSRKLPGTVAVLLTRAEEVGFVGCIAAVQAGTLLRASDRIVGIECSAVQPYALQGNGVILRVGDRTSVFNSQLTHFINARATDMAKRDKAFKFQRQLMPGGTCESTVYDAFGHIAAAVCVPLGNYHNMDRAKKKLAAEYIDRDDWLNMVKLFVELARTGHTFEPGHGPLKAALRKRFQTYRANLSPTGAV